MSRNLVGGISTLVVIAYAVGSGIWVSTNSGWYQSLVRPPWQPPDVVFGLIWPYNFVVLGVAGWIVASRGSDGERTIFIAALALSVAAALAWSYLFYVPHALVAASVALVAAAALTAPLVFVAFRSSVPVGVALIPYQAWVTIAASLSIGYAQRN